MEGVGVRKRENATEVQELKMVETAQPVRTKKRTSKEGKNERQAV